MLIVSNKNSSSLLNIVSDLFFCMKLVEQRRGMREAPVVASIVHLTAGTLPCALAGVVVLLCWSWHRECDVLIHSVLVKWFVLISSWVTHSVEV